MRITIIQTRTPHEPDVNEKIKWFSRTLGLFGERDRDASCYRVFIEMLKASRTETALSSDSLAFRLNLTRGTVVHHLNKLIEAGIIVPTRGGYILRVHNLEMLVDELRKDLMRSLSDLQMVARDIDEQLGL